MILPLVLRRKQLVRFFRATMQRKAALVWVGYEQHSAELPLGLLVAALVCLIVVPPSLADDLAGPRAFIDGKRPHL